jgi:phosphoglycolate phosphatase
MWAYPREVDNTRLISQAEKGCSMSQQVSAVLWDIDGTLLTSGGVSARSFLDAVLDVTGLRPEGRNLDLGGRIDPEIATVLLETIGHDSTLVPQVLVRLAEICSTRVTELNEKTEPLVGVVVLLELLAAAGVRQTVVTGNIESVGRLKLQAAGLVPPIELEVGGYGDHGSDRAAVGASALRRLADSGWSGSLDQCWIVGDTPRDLLCAQALGLRCALVASGRHTAESMADLGADIVLADLSDAAELLELWHLTP